MAHPTVSFSHGTHGFFDPNKDALPPLEEGVSPALQINRAMFEGNLPHIEQTLLDGSFWQTTLPVLRENLLLAFQRNHHAIINAIITNQGCAPFLLNHVNDLEGLVDWASKEGLASFVKVLLKCQPEIPLMSFSSIAGSLAGSGNKHELQNLLARIELKQSPEVLTSTIKTAIDKAIGAEKYDIIETLLRPPYLDSLSSDDLNLLVGLIVTHDKVSAIGCFLSCDRNKEIQRSNIETLIEKAQKEGKTEVAYTLEIFLT